MTPRHVALPLSPRAPAEPLVRDWLAVQWKVRADMLPLERDTRGRPRLGAPMQAFDAGWSHCGGWLLAACGEGLRLGCDLERLRPRPNARALARRFFHPREGDWLDALSGEEVDAAFVRLWCAKEAVLKAHGHGLSFGLHRLRFAESESGLVLAECDPRLGQAEGWHLHEFMPVPDYLAAIAWHPLPAPESGAAIMPG